MSSPPNSVGRAIKSAIGRLPSQFWFLWTGILINRLGTFVFPLLALYLTQRRGFSDQQVGFTIALYGVGNVIGGQVGGWLADRVGRRTTMLFGLTTGAIAMVALGLAEARPTVAACTFVLGPFGDSHRPVMQAMVADLVAPADRARAYGLVYWVLNLGFALAAMLAGFIRARLGHRAHRCGLWLDRSRTLGLALHGHRAHLDAGRDRGRPHRVDGRSGSGSSRAARHLPGRVQRGLGYLVDRGPSRRYPSTCELWGASLGACLVVSLLVSCGHVASAGARARRLGR